MYPCLQVRILHNERTSGVGLLEENMTAVSTIGSGPPGWRPAAAGNSTRVRLPTQFGWAHPVWRLRQCHLYGGVRDIAVGNNTGDGWGFAVDLLEYSLQGPLANITVTGNNASGVRLMVAKLWYNGQGLAVENASITDNNITDQVSGLWGAGRLALECDADAC